jgi:Methyltransferase domain
MADESMVRNLAAQAEAIWPQEEPIFERHPPGCGAVLDVGCGTGEITARLAEKFPNASFTGVDLEGTHLARARVRGASFGSRVQFEVGDALALSFADATFDLVVCRHLIRQFPMLRVSWRRSAAFCGREDASTSLPRTTDFSTVIRRSSMPMISGSASRESTDLRSVATFASGERRSRFSTTSR